LDSITDSSKEARVAIVGMGYVGAVSAACLARLGHRVYGIERDPVKVERLRAGFAPFHEPGLEPELKAQVDDGRVTIHEHLSTIVDEVDIVLICVGTPTAPDGSHMLTQVDRACEEVAAAVAASGSTRDIVLAVRSTVPPGTTAAMRDRFFAALPNVSLGYNPEFLREGTAIADFFAPGLIVVGAQDPAVAQRILDLYAGIPDSPRRVLSLAAAEMVKGVCNAFHALKIAFANETGTLAAACGIDPQELMGVICDDTRLNISKVYLRPGFAFGGSWLPKDLRAINHLAKEKQTALPLYASVLPSNDAHLDRAAAAVAALGKQKVGLIGISFKHDTDDMRESPALGLASRLLARNIELLAYDSDIKVELLHGVNLATWEAAVPGGKSVISPSLDRVLHWAECIVITKKMSPGVLSVIKAAGLPTIDVRQLAMAK
jgi:GDP-mannose 6-dehydrogenase